MNIALNEKQQGFIMGADFAHKQLEEFLNERIHYHGGARTVQSCISVLNDMIQYLNEYNADEQVVMPQPSEKTFYIIVDNTKM